MIISKTNDGQFGVNNRWFNTDYKAKVYAAILLDIPPTEFASFFREYDQAIAEMRANNHSYADIGICGSLICTMEEPPNE